MITITKKKEECKFNPIKLLPHQKHLLASLDEDRYPIYICWGMGSGKTIGACMCMTTLAQNSKVLIICDKSTVIQWQSEVEKLLDRNASEFPNIIVNIIHYEFLEQECAPVPRLYDMTIVDEAHRFRNAWSRQSARMLHWIYLINACQRVVYLSGTPIVHDASAERLAFDKLMGPKILSKRVFFYNPRLDAKSERKYPKQEELTVFCEMSWAQCFLYMLNRKQEFLLKLDGDDVVRSRVSSSKNTYNTLLRAFSNNPFPENPAASPKFQEILKHIEYHDNRKFKQIVYSSRKDTGVKALQTLWHSFSGKVSYQITGDMDLHDRAEHIKKFNRKSNSILFITDAGGQGIDLKRVDVVHIMEPAENIQDEMQIVNRAIRYKSHSQPDSIVTVIRYVTSFPVSGSVAPPWKRVLYESGMFDKTEMKGITRRVQYSLKRLIEEEENNETIDQKVIRVRNQRELHVQEALHKLREEAS
jgi:SNF2 family DNA or RNA helicase